MSWLRLSAEALYLMSGPTVRDQTDVKKIDADTYVLDVPITWLRANDAPRQMVVTFGSFTSGSGTDPWRDRYGGIEENGSTIPYNAITNPVGAGQETLGTLMQFEGLEFVRGKVSWFGGSGDTGQAADATTALTCERIRDLNAPDDYFCGMRWGFEPNGRQFWINKRILIVNPANRKAVVARAVDWGPPSRTGRILNVSRNTLTALEAVTDNDLLVALAKSDNPSLGPL
ncbi:MAG: hypothetical protein VKK04_11920 [Synechococcales bacterium]|nr:hypothetical protein [Synechococcales bacterium]